MKEKEKTMRRSVEEVVESKDSPTDVRSKTANKIQRSSMLRSINPLGMRVVVEIRQEENQTETGLFLPEGAKEAQQQSVLGVVLEVASALDSETQEEHNISGIPEGALVLIDRQVGTTVPWNDQIRIVETADVLAIVTEDTLS